METIECKQSLEDPLEVGENCCLLFCPQFIQIPIKSGLGFGLTHGGIFQLIRLKWYFSGFLGEIKAFGLEKSTGKDKDFLFEYTALV